jgi:intracellular sulfur oxidation DsrE/DsrF family protein
MYSEVGYGPATIAMPRRHWNVTVPDLLPGFVKVDRGVVRIAELQAQGYAYLQP